MRAATRRRWRVVPALLLPLVLIACGGGGGGGTGGGPPPGGNNPPQATLVAPTLGVAGLLGDSFTLSFVSNDDDAASVRLIADADGDPGTTGDQTVLFTGVDGDGAQQDVDVDLQAPLTQGSYLLVLEVNDGVNAPVVIQLPQPLVIYPAIAGVAPPRSNRYGVIDQTVVFSRGEAEDNAGPLNGDGLADDGVMVLYDAVSGVLTQGTPTVSMDVGGVGGGRVRPVLGQAGVLAWFTLEADENRNLNATNGENPIPPLGGADVDQTDTMVSYVLPGVSPLPVTNTYGGASAIVGFAQEQILVKYAEAGEGLGGTVINVDADTADSFFGYVDPLFPGPVHEFNQVVFHSLAPGPALGLRYHTVDLQQGAWLTTEAGGPILFDANLDGDQGDTYVAIANQLQTGGTGAPAFFTSFAGVQAAPAQPPSPVDPTGGFGITGSGFAGYYIDEVSNNLPPGGAGGNDRNGDFVIGMVAAFYDSTLQAETIPVGAAGPINSVPGSPLLYDVNRMFFTASEAPRADPAAGTNGDGDGGADLQIVYWTDHTVPAPVSTPLMINFPGIPLTGVSLDLGGSMVQLAPGWIALTVNEVANGNVDINGSGAIDFAYLLVDTAAAPMPVVHNPEVVPSTTPTFPLTGLYGEDALNSDRGVVLRLTEQANGDLDSDGNATEIFFAYISFNAPSVVRLLDGGGDHCAVADGRIGFTADEAYTGQDYDDNGSSTDVLFRVLDFAGNELQRGLPCSRLSVPVTEIGRLWAFLRDEATEGRNLNGDGDQTDLVLGLWIP